jgi:hypothetical protein
MRGSEAGAGDLALLHANDNSLDRDGSARQPKHLARATERGSAVQLERRHAGRIDSKRQISFLNQLASQQIKHGARDRGATDAGVSGNLGTGQRAMSLQGCQDLAGVQLAQERCLGAALLRSPRFRGSGLGQRGLERGRLPAIRA